MGLKELFRASFASQVYLEALAPSSLGIHTGSQQHMAPPSLHVFPFPQLQHLPHRWEQPRRRSTPRAPPETPDPNHPDGDLSIPTAQQGWDSPGQTAGNVQCLHNALWDKERIQTQRNPNPNIVLRFPVPCQAHEAKQAGAALRAGAEAQQRLCAAARAHAAGPAAARRFLIYSKTI